jgi:hypothetical protein
VPEVVAVLILAALCFARPMAERTKHVAQHGAVHLAAGRVILIVAASAAGSRREEK